MFVAISTWLTSFVCWPAPGPPWRTIVLPIACQHGRRASIASAWPPIMIDSRASRAPTSPPETGASMLATPLRAANSAISTASEGWLVVMSTRIEPSRQPPSAPSGPRITLRTSAGYPTIVNTTSEAAATALGESAQAAPFATRGSAFHRVRLKTVAEKPASIKWPHMLAPITPVPIQPIRVLPGST